MQKIIRSIPKTFGTPKGHSSTLQWKKAAPFKQIRASSVYNPQKFKIQSLSAIKKKGDLPLLATAPHNLTCLPTLKNTSLLKPKPFCHYSQRSFCSKPTLLQSTHLLISQSPRTNLKRYVHWEKNLRLSWPSGGFNFSDVKLMNNNQLGALKNGIFSIGMSRNSSSSRNHPEPPELNLEGWPTPSIQKSIKSIEKRITKISARVHPDRVASAHPTYAELNQKSLATFKDYFEQWLEFVIRRTFPHDLIERPSPMEVRFVFRGKTGYHPLTFRLFLPSSVAEPNHSSAAYGTLGILESTLEACEKEFEKVAKK